MILCKTSETTLTEIFIQKPSYENWAGVQHAELSYIKVACMYFYKVDLLHKTLKLKLRKQCCKPTLESTGVKH